MIFHDHFWLLVIDANDECHENDVYRIQGEKTHMMDPKLFRTSELRGFEWLQLISDHLLPFTTAWNNFSCLTGRYWFTIISACARVISCYFICSTHDGNSPVEIICYLICKPNNSLLYLLFLLARFRSWQLHTKKPPPVYLKNSLWFIP